MSLVFSKMNGAGNDFILIDNRDQSIRLTREQVVRLCDRQRGVGADGVFLLIPSQTGQADWAWEFYNSDGSTAEMCGNGARCFARYVQRVVESDGELTFETGAGLITATFDGNQVTVDLTDPKELRLNQTIELSSGRTTIHSVNTGVPHAVMFVEDADRAMVGSLGREIRYHKQFAPAGANVNFAQLKGDNAIRVRTYERGVEGETLACGTGVTAAALTAACLYDFSSPVSVQVQSGDWLEVCFDRQDDHLGHVRLKGPADFIFEGEIDLEATT